MLFSQYQNHIYNHLYEPVILNLYNGSSITNAHIILSITYGIWRMGFM